MFALLFLFAFQKDESFTHLSCLPFTLASLAKHSSFYPFFCSLTTSPCKKMTCTLHVQPLRFIARSLRLPKHRDGNHPAMSGCARLSRTLIPPSSPLAHQGAAAY